MAYADGRGRQTIRLTGSDDDIADCETRIADYWRIAHGARMVDRARTADRAGLPIAGARRQTGTVLTVALALVAGRLRRRQGVPAGRHGDAQRPSRRGGGRVPQGACRRRPTTPTTRLRCSARCRRRRGRISKRRMSSRQKDQLEAALGEYRQASEYDPSNRHGDAKVAELDRTIRDRIEAARPEAGDRRSCASARAPRRPSRC